MRACVYFEVMAVHVVLLGTNVKKENEEEKEKTSIELLNQAYHVLMRKNIKDSLTSFIATVPGNPPLLFNTLFHFSFPLSLSLSSR